MEFINTGFPGSGFYVRNKINGPLPIPLSYPSSSITAVKKPVSDIKQMEEEENPGENGGNSGCGFYTILLLVVFGIYYMFDTIKGHIYLALCSVLIIAVIIVIIYQGRKKKSKSLIKDLAETSYTYEHLPCNELNDSIINTSLSIASHTEIQFPRGFSSVLPIR